MDRYKVGVANSSKGNPYYFFVEARNSHEAAYKAHFAMGGASYPTDVLVSVEVEVTTPHWKTVFHN